jgi:GxxExxY protein
MVKTEKEDDPSTRRILEAALEVHSELGRDCWSVPLLLRWRLPERSRDIVWAEKTFPILFRGKALGDYRPDLIVENYVVVEIKSVERYDPVFPAQMLTNLRVTRLRLGLIINFNRPRLIDGVKRVVL